MLLHETSGHVGVDNPRTDRVHKDVVGGHLQPQTASQSDHCMLGCVVGTLVARAPLAGRRRKIDYPPLPPFHHPGQGRLCDVKNAVDVALHHCTELLKTVVDEAVWDVDPRVVHEHVYRPYGIDCGNHRAYGIAVCHIARRCDHLYAVIPRDRVTSLLQPVRIPGVQGQRAALRSESLGDGLSYSPAPAGNQRVFAC